MLKFFVQHNKKIIEFVLILFLSSCFLACNNNENTLSNTATLVFEDGLILGTPSLTLLKDQNLTIINNDDIPHTVTSQTLADSFVSDDQLDVEVPSHSTLVVASEDLPPTSFSFFCQYSKSALTPSSGTITIK